MIQLIVILLSFFTHLLSLDYEVIATDLYVPWEIVFLPDGDLLVTERNGQIRQIGKQPKTYSVKETAEEEESGLLGMTLHPQFAQNHFLYIYNTVSKDGKKVNRVERYRFADGELNDKILIIDDIPGAIYHDGGRMAFGPDGYLYITTGDADRPQLAQDKNSLAGKILRLKDDGTIPPDNPFHNAIYSYGHRNSQGLAWDASHNLWSTEHGPSGFFAGYDEINLIEKGKNYGWPIIQGDERREGMVTPLLQSGKTVWAPASALYWDGSLFFGGLRGEALYEASLGQKPIQLKEHFKNQFGRIRAVVLGPDGNFYITTSNRDQRGIPRKGDDKVIKLNPKIFREKLTLY